MKVIKMVESIDLLQAGHSLLAATGQILDISAQSPDKSLQSCAFG